MPTEKFLKLVVRLEKPSGEKYYEMACAGSLLSWQDVLRLASFMEMYVWEIQDWSSGTHGVILTRHNPDGIDE
jgi:hypothetical protein